VPGCLKAERARRPCHSGRRARSPRWAARRCSPIHSWLARRRMEMRAIVERGVHSVCLRFALTEHGTADHGFIAVTLPSPARRASPATPGDGANRWAAVHRSDAARLVALGLQKAPACTPSPNKASPPARSPRQSAARSTCPSPRSLPTTSPTTSAGSAPTWPWTSQLPAPRPKSSSGGRPPDRPSSRTSTPARTRRADRLDGPSIETSCASIPQTQSGDVHAVDGLVGLASDASGE
jgi:hypothetical protein